MKTENTMWPEKIDAIYAQFPWLEKVYPRHSVSRAFVKRFDESTLELTTETEELPYGDFFLPNYYTSTIVSLWLVDQNGIATALGQTTVTERALIFFRAEKIKHFNQTIRSAIQSLPPNDKSSYVVMVQHANNSGDTDAEITRITVFKPPQNDLTLRQWYAEQIAQINKTVAEEIESV